MSGAFADLGDHFMASPALSGSATLHADQATAAVDAPAAPEGAVVSQISSDPSDEVRTDGQWKASYAEIATLAGGLAHEIRNTLSTIRLNLELLDEELSDDGSPRDRRNRQKVRQVLRECGHLDQILNDFLQFARAHAPRLEPAAFNDVVREFLELFTPLAAEQRVEVSPHLAAQLPPVLLDARQFRQVLENLSRNALQAMPSGGLLEVLTYEQCGQVILEIIDNGCGMDNRTRDRMWDTFFSTKSGGSGLGLPTVRRIVDAHGGTMECESSVGTGTRFRIRLPIANS